MKPLNNQTIKDVLGLLGITGNNVYDSVIQQGDNNSVIVVVINIGHTTYGDNSPIDGDIAVNDVETNHGVVGIQGDNTAVAGNSNQS